ncbi:hypothetical protein Tco_0360201 [Tanacetum coccineum]
MKQTSGADIQSRILEQTSGPSKGGRTKAEPDNSYVRSPFSKPKRTTQICFNTAEPLSVILYLEPKKLARPTNVPASRDTHVFPPLVKESTMTHVFKSLEFPFTVIPASSTAALEPNEEWVNVMVDGTEHEMTDGVVNAKPSSMVRACSSGPSEVVVALSIGEKGDGSMPSSTVDEEAAATPSGV